MIQIFPIDGLPEIEPGQDLGAMLVGRLRLRDPRPQAGDVLVVTQKVVSKAEGRVVDLATVRPSGFAESLAMRYGKDPRLVQLVLDETVRVVRMTRGVFIMETRHGLICANAGVDGSNTRAGQAVLLPLDPDASAARLRERLLADLGVPLAVLISDTFGRPWRVGQTNVAIGVAGMKPTIDYRGRRDDHGNELRITEIAVADELAAAAELAMQKTSRCPAALIRGATYEPGTGSARDLIRPADLDLFP